MSLQGTFDILALPELLRMLASTNKTGELLIESGGVAGRLEFHDGSCCGAESTDARGAVTSEDELHRRAIDVCFAIVRKPGGSFRFTGHANTGTDAAIAIVVEPMLGELELLSIEWEEICTVVPSTDLRPAFTTTLPGDDILLSAREWNLLSRLDGYTPISGLVETSRESLVEVCRAVADLVRRGALELHPPATLGSRPEGTTPMPDGASDVEHNGSKIVPVAPYGPGVDDVREAGVTTLADVSGEEPPSGLASGVASELAVETSGELAGEPPGELPSELIGDLRSEFDADVTGEAAVLSSADPRDRGAILRLFSGLREA